MKRWSIVLTAVFLNPFDASAGLHLGMKLACKRYGDAWSAGDRSALEQAVTPEFASVWRRVPPAVFAALPQSNSSDSAVLTSQKSDGQAAVSVQTSDGVVVFHLHGSGFQWLVDDLDVENAHGESVSLKHSLAASLASRDFLIGLGDPRGRSWKGCLSRSFQASIDSLEPGDWPLVQAYLPKVSEPPTTKKPVVRFFGNLAVIRVPLPSSKGSTVQITLVREGAWKVDDLEIAGRSLQIPSFRKGMPALATVAKLGKFMKDPKSIDPSAFVGEAKLRAELGHVHSGKADAGGLGSQKMEHLRIAKDTFIYVKYPTRWIAVAAAPIQGTMMITSLQLHEAGAWRNAAELLALKRTIQSSPLADWLGGVTMNDPK